jgi:porin
MRRIVFVVFMFPLLAMSQSNEKSLELSAKYTGDYAVLNNNDYKHFSVYLGNIDLTLNFNTEKAKLWKGGTLWVYVLNNHGDHPSEDYTGDIQVFSNIEAPQRTKLFELWYEQVFNDKLSIKLGQQNINSEFLCSENGANFINSSFGVIPSVSGNFPVSIFPNTTLGARVMYTFNSNWGAQVAVFDGEPGDEKTNKYGAKWMIGKHEGADVLAELHYNLKKGENKIGTYKVGYWYHSGNFADVNDTNKIYKGNYGVYLLADQLLLAEPDNDEQGLGAFITMGLASKYKNFISYGIGGGLCYTGLFNNRNEDVVGIAFTNATINNDFAKRNLISKSENTIELTYSLKVNNFVSLQPDFQYIINPGGAMDNNAFIALLRFGVEF